MDRLRVAKADHIGRMSRDDVLVLRVLRLQDAKQGLDRRRMQEAIDLVDDDDSFVNGHNCREQRDNLGDARAAGVQRKAQLHPFHRFGRPDAHFQEVTIAPGPDAEIADRRKDLAEMMDQLPENVPPLTVQGVEHIRQIARVWLQAIGAAGRSFANRHAFSCKIEHLALPGGPKQSRQ
jgi:hypothetical protein